MKKRLLRVVLLLGAAALLFIGYLLLWHFTGIGFFCPINRFLHLDCPGCGITRASLSLLTLDLGGVLQANLFAPLIILYVVYVALYVSVRYIKSGKYEVTPKPQWLNVTFLILLLVWGAVRNLSAFQALL